jgi:hypothetical protein
MSLDIPASGSSTTGAFSVGGWAVDLGAASGTGIDTVHVWATPTAGAAIFVGVANYGQSRSDLAALYGTQFGNSGFRLDNVVLPPGSYQLVAYAHSTLTNAFVISRAATVTVTTPVSLPAMALDAPQNGAQGVQPLGVAGWAIDRGATAGCGVSFVHAWAFPVVNGVPDAAHGVFVGQASVTGARPDVGAVYGTQFSTCGFGLSVSGLPPGPYVLVVYAYSSVAAAFNDTRSATIQAH